MPGYFFSNAAVTGRTSWLMIWVEYQLTSPSFLAASIRAASAAYATLVTKEAASAQAKVEVRRATGSPFIFFISMCRWWHRVARSRHRSSRYPVHLADQMDSRQHE